MKFLRHAVVTVALIGSLSNSVRFGQRDISNSEAISIAKEYLVVTKPFRTFSDFYFTYYQLYSLGAEKILIQDGAATNHAYSFHTWGTSADNDQYCSVHLYLSAADGSILSKVVLKGKPGESSKPGFSNKDWHCWIRQDP